MRIYRTAARAARAIIIIITAALLLTACDGGRYGRMLADVESCIQERPDSALAVLENIDRGQLRTEELRAKYALLYSMVLDKNYIDVTSDSIIAPAVEYYKRFGNAEEKFNTFYYCGRVFQNAGYIEKAMRQFVEAEYYITDKVDKSAIARLYKAKMIAYQDIFDFRSALDQAELASKFFLSANDTSRYLNTVNDIAVLYFQSNNQESVEEQLDILSSNYSRLTQIQKSHYHSNMLNYALRYSEEQISDVLADYISAVQDEEMLNWIFIADAYIRLSDYSSAANALEKYLYYGGEADAAYYGTVAMLYEEKGASDMALAAFKEYLRITDNTDISIFESDTKFIEERYKAKLKDLRQTLFITIIVFSSAVLVLVLMLLFQKIRKIKRERLLERLRFDEERDTILDEKNQAQEKYLLLKEEAEEMYISLKAEISKLKRVKKEQHINKDILLAIDQRLHILNMFILGEVSSSFNKIAFMELKKLLENREEFLESTKHTFLISNPKFISYLRAQNLTEWEIGCCCLYCIGFNSSEISEYLNRKAIYNLNSTIRHKLGIPKGKTKIDVFLKHKMEEYQS